MKYIAIRNFCSSTGSKMIYSGDILEGVTADFVSDWTGLGLIQPYTETADPIPAFVSTGTGIGKVEVIEKPIPEIKHTGGKPKKTIKK